MANRFTIFEEEDEDNVNSYNRSSYPSIFPPATQIASQTKIPVAPSMPSHHPQFVDYLDQYFCEKKY